MRQLDIPELSIRQTDEIIEVKVVLLPQDFLDGTIFGTKAHVLEKSIFLRFDMVSAKLHSTRLCFTTHALFAHRDH